MDNFTISAGDAIFNFADLTIPLNITSVWDVKLHEHFSYEVHFIVSGAATLCFHDKNVTLYRGDCIFIAPGTDHFVHASTVQKLSVRFYLEQQNKRGDNEFSSYTSKLEAIDDFVVMKFNLSTVEKLMRVSSEQYISDFFTRKAFRIRLLSLFNDSIAKIRVPVLSVEENAKTSLASQLEMRKIKMEIWYENNLASASVEYLANALCLGVKQTERVVKAITGKTFKRYLYEYRMKRAGYLCRIERRSCDEIAREIGYSSAANFRNAFKKFYGVTPDEYKDDEK